MKKLRKRMVLGVVCCSLGIAGCKGCAVPGAAKLPTVSVTPSFAPTSPGTVSPILTHTPIPTASQALTDTPMPTATQVPTDPPTLAATQAPTDTPTPAASQTPTDTPMPTASQAPTDTPTPTVSQVRTPIPTPTDKPRPSNTPIPTHEPTQMSTPTVTPTPVIVRDEIGWEEVEDRLSEYLRIQKENLSKLIEPNAEKRGETFTRANLAVTLVQVIRYLQIEADSSCKEAAMKKGRLVDLQGLGSEEKDAFYTLYAMGIMEGDSCGTYTRKRNMMPQNKVTKEELERYLNRLFQPANRRKLTNDAQLIREKNLPEFAAYYAYILDDFPNSFYDWEFHYMKSEAAVPMSLSPKEMRTDRERVFELTFKEYIERYGEQYVNIVEAYLQRVFQVDYRNTPKDAAWKQFILQNNANVNSGQGYRGEAYTQFKLEAYLQSIVENQTIIECDLAASDDSLFYCDGGDWYLRCYVHYRILSAKSVKPVKAGYSRMVFSQEWGGSYLNVVLGEWRDGYLDVLLGTAYEPIGKLTILDTVMSDGFYFYRMKTEKE